MTRLGLPTFQGKAYFRYHTRDERTDIQSLMRHMRYPHPDTTSVTIFSNGSDGVAEIEVHELLPGNQIGLLPEDDTPKIRAALQWLTEHLKRIGIHPPEAQKTKTPEQMPEATPTTNAPEPKPAKPDPKPLAHPNKAKPCLINPKEGHHRARQAKQNGYCVRFSNPSSDYLPNIDVFA